MDKVRVAMVGCGGFQRYRVSNLLKVKEAEIVALVDPSEDQIKMMREAHPSTQELPAFSDHKAMMESIRPDAIMIATPHTQHVDQIVDGLEAGCNVCCEKPLVTTVADAHKIIKLRDSVKKIGMVSYQRHFQAEYRTIRDRIKSGEAGEVQFIAALQGQSWLRGTKVTWRMILWVSGGVQINDSGSHLIDIILWSTGVSVESVSAYTDNFGTEVDINSAVSLKFKNGAQGTLSVVGNGFGWHEDVTIFCENMVFYVREGKLSTADRADNRYKAENLGGGSTPDKNFIDSIRGVAECESPFECGLEVIRLTEAAWASAAKSGAAVQVTS
jgi:predicted dehydrogenase